jgi:hypothetical protein
MHGKVYLYVPIRSPRKFAWVILVFLLPGSCLDFVLEYLLAIPMAI